MFNDQIRDLKQAKVQAKKELLQQIHLLASNLESQLKWDDLRNLDDSIQSVDLARKIGQKIESLLGLPDIPSNNERNLSPAATACDGSQA